MTHFLSRPRFAARHAHALLLPLGLLACGAAAHATTINVPSGDYPTIQSAVDGAANGDTILLADGIYTGPGNVDVDPRGKNLTITSAHGAAATVIDCGGSNAVHRGFYIHSGETITISGLTVKNGSNPSGSGGAIYNSATLTLTDCVLTGNSVANPTTTASNSNSGGGLFNSGTATLTGCTVSGNAAVFGGGIYSFHGAGISLTLTRCTLSSNSVAGGPYGGYGGGLYGGSAVSAVNCVISGNTTDYAAGGFLGGSAGTATLTNCTFTGNSAPAGNGGGIVVFGAATLTNDILYGNTGGNADDGDTTAAATYCDIDYPGGYPGTGNLNTAPRFVSATDLHLRPGSPCLGAGTSSSAPAADFDGTARPAPPSIGAYEIAAAGTIPAGSAHVLWANSNGQASVWNMADASPAATCKVFGPYPGWTAQAVAEGPDGNVRLLWDSTDGQVSVWNLADANPAATCKLYGPYSGWSGKALAVGPDNAAHLLWDNTDGRVSLWNLNDASPAASSVIYGPYSGWSGTAIAIGPDNKERLLWNSTGGQASVWDLSDANPAATCKLYGPYSGWTANALAVGPDNAAHLLWDNTGGPVSLWNLADADPAATCQIAGPYAGWAGTAIAIGADDKERLLWDNSGGPMSLWNLANPNPAASCLVYGPFGGWTAIGISAH